MPIDYYNNYYNYPAYAYGSYASVYSPGGYGYGGLGIRWIYALLLLIVIVLQFGTRRNVPLAATDVCGNNTLVAGTGTNCNNQIIDNSVLFIIVVFLLIICSGCLSSGGYGARSGYGGYGYYY